MYFVSKFIEKLLSFFWIVLVLRFENWQTFRRKRKFMENCGRVIQFLMVCPIFGYKCVIVAIKFIHFRLKIYLHFSFNHTYFKQFSFNFIFKTLPPHQSVYQSIIFIKWYTIFYSNWIPFQIQFNYRLQQHN